MKKNHSISATTTTTSSTSITSSKNKNRKRKGSSSQRRRGVKPQPGDPNFKTPTQLRNARKRRRQKEDQQQQQQKQQQHHHHQQYQQEQCSNVTRTGNNNATAAAAAATTTHTSETSETYNGNTTASKKKKKNNDTVTAKKKQKINGNNGNVNGNINININTKAINTLDPSLKYISKPVQAPTVQAAIKFFRHQQEQAQDPDPDQAQQQQKATFQVYVGPYLGWRTVARLAVRCSGSSSSSSSSWSSKGLGGNNNNNNHKLLRIGLFAPKSHTIVEQPQQRHQKGADSSSSSSTTPISVHHRRVDTLISIVQKKCRQYQIQAYDERSGNGNLRHVAVSIQRSTGKQQLVLVWNDDHDHDRKDNDDNDDNDNDNDNDGNGKKKNTMNNNSPRDLLIQSLIEMSRKEEEKYNRFVQQQLDKQQKQKKVKQQKQQQKEKTQNQKQEPPLKSLSTSTSTSTSLAKMYSNHNQGPVHLHSLWVHTNNSWKHANNIIDRDGTWDLQYCRSKSSRSKTDDSESESESDTTDSSEIVGTSFFLEERLVGSISNIHPNLYIPLYFPPQVFRQANLDGFAKIISSIRRWLISSFVAGDNAGDDGSNSSKNGNGDRSYNDHHHSRSRPIIGHCLELYGGVGTIGLHLIDLISSLESSDENPYNKKCFELSVKRLGWIQSTTSTDDDATDVTATNSSTSITDNETSNRPYSCPKSKIVYKSKSATQMVDSGALRNAEIVIVDPPRKGLDDEVVSALCRCRRDDQLQTNKSRSNDHHPHRQQRRHQNEQQEDEQQHNNIQALIYVSCGFDAFQRDYHRLVGSGIWELDHAEGHVLFPGSDAIETLACFRRTS